MFLPADFFSSSFHHRGRSCRGMVLLPHNVNVPFFFMPGGMCRNPPPPPPATFFSAGAASRHLLNSQHPQSRHRSQGTGDIAVHENVTGPFELRNSNPASRCNFAYTHGLTCRLSNDHSDCVIKNDHSNCALLLSCENNLGPSPQGFRHVHCLPCAWCACWSRCCRRATSWWTFLQTLSWTRVTSAIFEPIRTKDNFGNVSIQSWRFGDNSDLNFK